VYCIIFSVQTNPISVKRENLAHETQSTMSSDGSYPKTANNRSLKAKSFFGHGIRPYSTTGPRIGSSHQSSSRFFSNPSATVHNFTEARATAAMQADNNASYSDGSQNAETPCLTDHVIKTASFPPTEPLQIPPSSLEQQYNSGNVTPPIGTGGRNSSDSSSSFSMSPPARTKPVFNPMNQKFEFECVFCKSNNQPEEIYKTHVIRDPSNNTVICPFLREHVCMICKATGHTIKYCPMNKRGFFAYREAIEAKKKLAIQMSKLRDEQSRHLESTNSGNSNEYEPFRLTFNSITNTFEPPPRTHWEQQRINPPTPVSAPVANHSNMATRPTWIKPHAVVQPQSAVANTDPSLNPTQSTYSLSDPRWEIPTIEDMRLGRANNTNRNSFERTSNNVSPNETDALLNRILNLDFTADQIEMDD